MRPDADARGSSTWRLPAGSGASLNIRDSPPMAPLHRQRGGKPSGAYLTSPPGRNVLAHALARGVFSWPSLRGHPRDGQEKTTLHCGLEGPLRSGRTGPLPTGSRATLTRTRGGGRERSVSRERHASGARCPWMAVPPWAPWELGALALRSRRRPLGHREGEHRAIAARPPCGYEAGDQGGVVGRRLAGAQRHPTRAVRAV